MGHSGGRKRSGRDLDHPMHMEKKGPKGGPLRANQISSIPVDEISTKVVTNRIRVIKSTENTRKVIESHHVKEIG